MATIDEEYSFNILNTCDEGLKVCFRVFERNLLKTTAFTSHLCFNETCLNNKILLVNTNVNLYHNAIRRENFVGQIVKISEHMKLTNKKLH